MAGLFARQGAVAGPPPNFPPSYYRATDHLEVLGIPAIFTGLALMTVLLRMYVRGAILKAIGGDDYVIIAAMVSSVFVLVTQGLTVKYGLGHHAPAINPGQLEPLLRWRFVGGFFTVTAVSLVKISVAMALLRLFQRTIHRRFLWGMIAFLGVFTTACLGTILFQCVPINATWDYNVRLKPDTKCYSTRIFRDIGVFNSAINIATDFLFAFMPAPLIWQLQMNMRTRIALICVLALGLFASATAIVKCIYQYNFFSTPDWSFRDPFMVFATLELNVGITAASLPTLKAMPFFNWLLKTARAMTSGSVSQPQGPYTGSSSSYLKHADGSENRAGCYLAKPKPSHSISRSNRKDYYDVHVTTGSGSGDEEADYDRHWESPLAEKRDDYTLPRHGSMLLPEMGIMRTMEVRVSNTERI